MIMTKVELDKLKNNISNCRTHSDIFSFYEDYLKLVNLKDKNYEVLNIISLYNEKYFNIVESNTELN